MAVYVDPEIRSRYEQAREYYIEQGFPFDKACLRAKAVVLEAYTNEAGRHVAEAKTIWGGLGKFVLGAFSINSIDSMLGQCVLDDLK